MSPRSSTVTICEPGKRRRRCDGHRTRVSVYREIPFRDPSITTGKHVDDVLRELSALSDTAVAIVIGHFDTVPVIVERLTGEGIGTIDEDEYDRLCVVHAPRPLAAPPHLLKLRYGEP